jgi:hypothetical protein
VHPERLFSSGRCAGAPRQGPRKARRVEFDPRTVHQPISSLPAGATQEYYDVTSYSDDAPTVNGQVDPAKLLAFLPRRKQAAISKPKPINVAYVRSDDRADMIEIGPHQSASLDALLARRLMPSSIKAAEVA